LKQNETMVVSVIQGDSLMEALPIILIFILMCLLALGSFHKLIANILEELKYITILLDELTNKLN